MTVILTGPTTIRQRQGGRIRPQVTQDYQKSQEKQGMMLNVDLPIVWSRTWLDVLGWVEREPLSHDKGVQVGWAGSLGLVGIFRVPYQVSTSSIKLIPDKYLMWLRAMTNHTQSLSLCVTQATKHKSKYWSRNYCTNSLIFYRSYKDLKCLGKI